MRIATLDLTPELFIEFCKASKNGPPRYFKVIENPLPDDAEVVEVRLRDPWLPHTLRLVVKSEVFADVPEGATPPELPLPVYETTYNDFKPVSIGYPSDGTWCWVATDHDL